MKFFRASKRKFSLSEIYGSGSSMPEFTVVAEDGRQIGGWVRCKDFIQDVWWGHLNNVSYGIYGYNYNPVLDPKPSLNELLLALRWKGKTEKQLKSMLKNLRKTVDSVESKMPWEGKKGLPENMRSKFSEPEDGIIVVRGSKIYLRSVALLSFFTWLVRGSLLNKSGKLSEIKKTCPVKKDAYYHNSGQKFINELIKNGPNAFISDFDSYRNVSAVHNNGFVRWSGLKR